LAGFGQIQMEYRMRQIAVFAAVLAAGGVLLGASNPAHAGPTAVGVPAVASYSVVEEAGWRRYCRRYGCGPEVVLPGVEVIPGAEAEIIPGAEVDIDVDGDVPVVVVVPPPRPISCGQYRYWNGMACVDARYSDPYLGPR
jgi:hypothetical protein